MSLKSVFNTIPQNGGVCWFVVCVDDNDSSIILKLIHYKHKHILEKWFTLVARENYICWADKVGTGRSLEKSTMIKSRAALAFTTPLELLLVWYCMDENQTKSLLDSYQARKFWTLKIKWQKHSQYIEWFKMHHLPYEGHYITKCLGFRTIF